MPTRRKPTRKPFSRRSTLVRQLFDHVVQNGMTTMLGLSTGVPVIIDGYSSKDWNQLGSGVTAVILGLSGEDRFGVKSKSTTPAPGGPATPTGPPYE